MKTYTVDFYIHKRTGAEHLERIEMERPALTSRDMKIILADLLFFAWTNKRKNPAISAVIKRDGEKVVTVCALVDQVASTDLIRTVNIRIARPREIFKTIRKIPIAA